MNQDGRPVAGVAWRREQLSPLLIVDDDDVFRRRLARAFRERGLEVGEAASAEEALAACGQPQPPRAVVLDLRLGTLSGLSVLSAIAEQADPPRVLVLTGYGSIATAVHAVRLGAHAYLPKPADADEILEALMRAAEPRASIEPTPSWQAPSLARAEWEHIQRVLGDSGGNISEAARRLGIARRTLQLKLKKYPPRA